MRRDTKLQLQRLLNITDKPNETENSDERDSKRLRLSRTVSRSKSSHGKKPYYTDPSEIVGIFGTKLSPQSLCSLSTMTHGTPAEILKVVKNASVSQICKMCKLQERSKSRTQEPVTRQRGRHQSKAPKVEGRKHRRQKRRASPEPVFDEMKQVTDENARDHLDEDFTVPTTVNSGWTKRLKNLVQNAGVDRGNVEIVCSDNESLNDGSKSNDTKRHK